MPQKNLEIYFHSLESFDKPEIRAVLNAKA